MMLILYIALILHFECIQGFIIEVQNPLISKRFTRIKTIEKSLNIQIKLSNDELTEFGSNDKDDEGEEDGPSMKTLLDAQEGAPDEFAIMKELLGINIFTYILAGLIAFFLSLNLLLGPGWLGQSMGLEGTGTFTQISDSIPGTVDLSASENLL